MTEKTEHTIASIFILPQHYDTTLKPFTIIIHFNEAASNSSADQKVVCNRRRMRFAHYQVILEKHRSFSTQRDFFFNYRRLVERPRRRGIYWASTKSCLCCHTGVNWLLAGSWHQQNSTVGLRLAGPVRGAERVILTRTWKYCVCAIFSQYIHISFIVNLK